MPRLTHRDKLQALRRQPQFIRDIKKALARQNRPLSRMLSMDLTRRERLTQWDKRWKERMTGLGLPTDPVTLIKNLHANENISPYIVRAIPTYVDLGKAKDAVKISHLRGGRFLSLELDLEAPMDDLLKEIRTRIATFRPKQIQTGRRRKNHKTTSLNPWNVYNQVNRKISLYTIAREEYRKRQGTVSGFDSASPIYKAVSRAFKAAKEMIRSVPYPPQ